MSKKVYLIAHSVWNDSNTLISCETIGSEVFEDRGVAEGVVLGKIGGGSRSWDATDSEGKSTLRLKGEDGNTYLWEIRPFTVRPFDHK